MLAHRGEPRELIERAEAALFRIGHDGGSAEMRTIEAVLHEELDKLEELSRKGVGLTGTPSGFADLDSLTGGFQPGNLIVLAARPSMGKPRSPPTSPRTRRIDHGVPVALFSLEMSETELAHRFIASQAKVIERRAPEGPGARRIAGRRSSTRRRSWPARRSSSTTRATSACSRCAPRRAGCTTRSGLGLLVVDYLQLMRADAAPTAASSRSARSAAG